MGTIAEQQNTITLIETVKNALSKDAPKTLEDQTSEAVTTTTFKVHDDQKATVEAALAKAKEQCGSTVSTVALEFMALDFLGGQSMKQRLQKMGSDAALAAVADAFPQLNSEVSLVESEAAA